MSVWLMTAGDALTEPVGQWQLCLQCVTQILSQTLSQWQLSTFAAALWNRHRNQTLGCDGGAGVLKLVSYGSRLNCGKFWCDTSRLFHPAVNRITNKCLHGRCWCCQSMQSHAGTLALPSLWYQTVMCCPVTVTKPLCDLHLSVYYIVASYTRSSGDAERPSDACCLL